MSDEVNPQPVPENPVIKRVYKSRKHEFDDMDEVVMLTKLEEAKTQIKEAEKAKDANPTDPQLVKAYKEAVNYRVRIYERLRKLGHSRANRKNSSSNETPCQG